MQFAAYLESKTRKDVRRQWKKIVLLLILSLGLFTFSEGFSPESIFESQSTSWILWISYAKDLLRPAALYFFLCIGEKWLRTWQARALLAFAIPTLLEFGHALYYRMFSGHYVGAFDPLDILMYALGVGFAVLVEQLVFAKFIKVW